MVNRWWREHPSEIYWIEITSRPDIGANLKAPQSSNSGHFLVKEVQSGDVIYHYDMNRHAFVGRSYGTGELWEEEIEWPHKRPGWYSRIVGFEPVGPITLSRFQEDWDLISEKRKDLISMVKTAYFPFESGEKRPTRPVQGGYLCKMPRFMVEFLDLLDPGQPLTEKSTKSSPTPSIGISAKDIVSPFGLKLEAEMSVRSMNSAQIARLVDCNPSTIRNIISGRIKNPSDDMIKRIESVFDSGQKIEINDNTISPIDFDSEFAYEKDLQNFLVKNLDKIEEGLKLYDDGDINGVEFPAGNRRIDILAVDKENRLVVIELKVSRGHDRTLGQIQYYIGWIKQNLAVNQGVRGIIIAKDITEDLRMASSVADVELREYSISFSLMNVK